MVANRGAIAGQNSDRRRSRSDERGRKCARGQVAPPPHRQGMLAESLVQPEAFRLTRDMADEAPPPEDAPPPAQTFPVRAAPCATGEVHNVRLVPMFAWITSSQSSTGSDVRFVLNNGGAQPAQTTQLSRGLTGLADEYVVDLRHVDPSAKSELDHTTDAGCLVPKLSFVIADLRKKLADKDASGAAAAVSLPIDTAPSPAPPDDPPAPDSTPADPSADGGVVLRTIDPAMFDEGPG
jgi:hypothetical protein